MYISPAWFSAYLALFLVSSIGTVLAWHYARLAALPRPTYSGPAAGAVTPAPGPDSPPALPALRCTCPGYCDAHPYNVLPGPLDADRLDTMARLYAETPHCCECGQLGEPGADLVGNSFGETGKPLVINWYCKDVRACSDRKFGRMLAETATLPALCPCGSGRPRDLCPGSWHFPPPPALIAEPHVCDHRDPCSPEDGWICAAGRRGYYPRRTGQVTR